MTRVDVDWLLDNRPGKLPRDLPSLEFLMIAWGFKLHNADDRENAAPQTPASATTGSSGTKDATTARPPLYDQPAVAAPVGQSPYKPSKDMAMTAWQVLNGVFGVISLFFVFATWAGAFEASQLLQGVLWLVCAAANFASMSE